MDKEKKFSFFDKIAYLFLFLSFPLIILIAWFLIPTEKGLGTHTELGLPPCGFYSTFHKPCPSCGMTTSFAYIVRFKLIEAFKAQPAGVFLFFSALFVYLTLPYHYVKKKKVYELLDLPYLFPILLANILIILLVWVIRLFR